MLNYFRRNLRIKDNIILKIIQVVSGKYILVFPLLIFMSPGSEPTNGILIFRTINTPTKIRIPPITMRYFPKFCIILKYLFNPNL